MGSLVGRHALWTGAILLACGQGADNEPSARGDVTSRATVTQTEQADSQEQPLSLEWTFEPDSEEVAAVRVLIRSLVDRQRDPPLGASGVLYRFGSEQAQTRYLLLTYMETGHMQNEPDAVLFVLDKPHNSEPMVIGRWGIGTWGPLAVKDYDDDGLPDVAFCEWPGENAQQGKARVAGYSGGSWYWISKPVGSLPECRR